MSARTAWPPQPTGDTAGPRTAWIRTFFREDLWQPEAPGTGWVRRSLRGTLQVTTLAVERCLSSRIWLLTSALTYSSALAIVPFLACLFALGKALGLQNRLEPFLLARVSPEFLGFIAHWFDVADGVRVGSLGAIGSAVLVCAAFFILNSAERAFNDIWGIARSRPWRRKATDYLAVLSVVPGLWLLALAVTTGLKNPLVAEWLRTQPELGSALPVAVRLLPFLALWVVMTFQYRFLPNTRVRWTPALAAGLLAGTVWQWTVSAVLNLQLWVAKYNLVYGTFAYFPVLLVWLYVSWMIVLGGAGFAYAIQTLPARRARSGLGRPRP